KLQKIFIECDVTKATATVLADRDRILQQIEKSIPSQTMNQHIKQALVESAELDAKHAESLVDSNPQLSASSFDTFGNICRFVAQYDTAYLYLDKALSIQEKALGADHPETATSLNNFASLLDNMGKYEQAEP